MTDDPKKSADVDGGQTGAEGEMAPDRPTEEAEDTSAAVQEEEAHEQSGV